jgi:hypothetical protein
MRSEIERTRSLIFCCVLTLFAFCTPVFAEPTGQPYIDQLKLEMKKKEKPGAEESESYIESIQKKLKKERPTEDSSTSYIEKLRASDPIQLENNPEESYTAAEKLKMAPQEEGGAIQALNEGRAELHPKKKGEIRNALGLRYGAALTRNFTSSSARNFNTIYGSSYAPDISLFYEYQPFHSERYGNIGIFGMGGIGYYHATGQFGFALPKPEGGTFPLATDVRFQFFTLPVTLGLDYRFNLFHYLRPYIMAGPTVIGYVELRNDPINGNRGNSRGLFVSVGTAIMLDWIFGSNTWSMYTNYGFKHTYLTIDYTRLNTFSGDISFDLSGFYAGMTFEY